MATMKTKFLMAYYANKAACAADLGVNASNITKWCDDPELGHSVAGRVLDRRPDIIAAYLATLPKSETKARK